MSTGTDTKTGRRTQVYQSHPTKREAQSARNALLAQLSAGQYRHDGRQKVGEYLPQWLEDKISDGLRPSSALMYRRYVEQDLVPALGRLRLADLRETHVEDMLRQLRTDGRGAVTIRRIHAVLRSALGAAKSKRLVAFNAAIDVGLPATDARKVRPWEPEEVGTFLDSASGHRLGALYELAVFSGLRRGEVTGLRWADVDMVRQVITVRTQRVQVGSAVVEGRPKTKAGEDRKVDLGDRAVGALMVHRLTQQAEREQWGPAYIDLGLVFTKENGEALLPQYVTRLFEKLSEAAGVRRVKFHDLRHTAASLMIAGGADLAIVSKRMGHSSLSITNDLYTHLVGRAGRSAADAAESVVPRSVHTLHTQHL